MAVAGARGRHHGPSVCACASWRGPRSAAVRSPWPGGDVEAAAAQAASVELGTGAGGAGRRMAHVIRPTTLSASGGPHRSGRQVPVQRSSVVEGRPSRDQAAHELHRRRLLPVLQRAPALPAAPPRAGHGRGAASACQLGRLERPSAMRCTGVAAAASASSVRSRCRARLGPVVAQSRQHQSATCPVRGQRFQQRQRGGVGPLLVVEGKITSGVRPWPARATNCCSTLEAVRAPRPRRARSGAVRRTATDVRRSRDHSVSTPAAGALQRPQARAPAGRAAPSLRPAAGAPVSQWTACSARQRSHHPVELTGDEAAALAHDGPV